MARSPWRPSLAPSAGAPVYLRLVAAVVDDVRAGRLHAGDRLPGSRAIAAAVGVNRNTVTRALDELEAQGWIRAVPSSGFVVHDALPRPLPPPRAAAEPAFPLPPVPSRRPIEDPPAGIRLVGGVPDLRLVPADALARAWRRALREEGASLLDYGDPRGERALREALATWLAARRGLPADPARVLVVRGASHGLHLCAHALVPRGGVVAVEEWGYAQAWEAFEHAGAALVPLPVDGDGADVEALAALPRVDAVYLTPHHQYPTGSTLSAARRERLRAVARERRLLVIEDDYDHEFHYRGHPVRPLAADDGDGRVIYVGTLSKAVAPGLRVGWVVAPASLVDRLGRLRRIIDRQGDRVTERAVAALLADGTVDRHIRKMQRIYARRRATLLAGLERSFGDALHVDVPAGGMAVWVDAPGIDVEAWRDRAAARGVWFQVAREFHLLGVAAPSFRLGFAGVPEEEIVRALGVLRATFPG